LDGSGTLTQGGSNSFQCYGWGQGIARNIMGAGEDFTVEDALPWVWAMMYLRRTPMEVWKAVAADPGPGTWVRT
jgi:hypothetical protein